MSRSVPSYCRVPVALLLMLLVGTPGQSSGQIIKGRTLDAKTDSVVRGAVVTLSTPDGERLRTTQSDSLGAYMFSDLEPARYVVKARRVGYRLTRRGTFSLGPEDTLSVTLTLRVLPVALEEVTVEEERSRRLRRVGYYDRKQSTSGHFLDRAEIKSMNPSQPFELFQEVPGMKVMGQVGAGTKGWVQTTGRSTIRRGKADKPCVPSIVVDGVLVRQGQIIDPSTTQRLSDVVSVSEIEALEVYPRANEAPAEYGGTRSPCGAILVWTRQGD